MMTLNAFNAIRVDPAKLRAARGNLEPKFVVQKLGISKQALSDYERGVAVPSGNKLAQLCVLYGVPITEITSIVSAG